MINRAERYIETFEERKENGESKLYYKAFDNKMHKVGESDLAKKQDTLVSGTNIKTVNGSSLVGSGDVLTSPAVVTVSGATPTQVLSPNTYYIFTNGVTSFSGVTLATPTDGIVNIYAFSFTAGADDIDPVASLANVEWANGFEPDLSSGDYCEVSIMNNIATFIAHTPADDDPTNPTEET